MKPSAWLGREPVEIPDEVGDALLSPAELYHENSKLRPSDAATFQLIHFVNVTPGIRSVIARPYTGYRGFPSTPLPRSFSAPSRPLEEVIRARRSARRFTGAPMGLEELARLLLLGGGITADVPDPDGTSWGFRAAPSGGGLFPIDLYCAVTNVEGLPRGVYFYDVRAHALERIDDRDPTEALKGAMAMPGAVEAAGVFILMTAVMPRIKFKYGERAYRFCMLEAGHIGQNVLLAAEDEGLGAVPVGGFIDDALNDLLRIDGCEHFVAYGVLAGRVR